MKSIEGSIYTLSRLLRDGPRTVASVREAMRSEGYTDDDIERASLWLKVIHTKIGKQDGWRLPVSFLK